MENMLNDIRDFCKSSFQENKTSSLLTKDKLQQILNELKMNEKQLLEQLKINFRLQKVFKLFFINVLDVKFPIESEFYLDFENLNTNFFNQENGWKLTEEKFYFMTEQLQKLRNNIEKQTNVNEFKFYDFYEYIPFPKNLESFYCQRKLSILDEFLKINSALLNEFKYQNLNNQNMINSLHTFLEKDKKKIMTNFSVCKNLNKRNYFKFSKIKEMNISKDCLKCKKQENNSDHLTNFINEGSNKKVFKIDFLKIKEKHELNFDNFIMSEIEKNKKDSFNLSEINKMDPFQKILIQLFLNIPFKNNEILNLTRNYEKKIIYLVLYKKKIFKETDNIEKLNKNEIIQEKISYKRVEENLKLIFKKFLKFFKKKFIYFFKDLLNPYMKQRFRENVNNSDYCFYGFYFDECAERLNQEIEKFFEPASYNQKSRANYHHSILIPKTITKMYISSLKLSPLFLKHMNMFIESIIIKQFQTSIVSKTLNLIEQWRELYDQYNESLALKKIKNNLKSNKRFTIVWTMNDITEAIKDSKTYLEN